MLAAGTIAELEIDRDAGVQARGVLKSEIARLRQSVDGAERRFAEVQRGRRLARVTEAVARAACRSRASIGACVLSDYHIISMP